MIAFPFYKGIAEEVLHEIVIFFSRLAFFRDTDGVIFAADDRGIISGRKVSSRWRSRDHH